MILPTAKAQPAKNPKSMLVNLDGGQGAITVGVGQANGRSFIRYIDFKCSSGLATDIVSSLTGVSPLLKMYLYPYGSSATGVPTQVYLPYGFSTQSGTVNQPIVTGSYGAAQLSSTGVNPTYLVRIDFGALGIAGYNSTSTNDGVYVFKIDQFKDGTYSYQAKTFRLAGDVTGDGIVATNDSSAITNAAVYGKFGLFAENADGLGQVYTGDTTMTILYRGRSITTLFNSIQI